MSRPKFSPKPDLEEINVSSVNPWKILLRFSAYAVGATFVSYWLVAFFFESVLIRISPETEARIFGSIAFALPGGKNTETDSGLSLLFHDLFPEEKAPPFLGALCSDSNLNAIAIPGKRILFTGGILSEVKSRGGLMFVLAHEWAHIVKRHHLRGMGRAIANSLLNSFFALGGVKFFLLSETTQMASLSYSRDQEAEADGYALSALVSRYGSLTGAHEFFQIVSKKAAPSGISAFAGKIQSFLQTHPSTDIRLENINELSAKYPEKTELKEAHSLKTCAIPLKL